MKWQKNFYFELTTPFNKITAIREVLHLWMAHRIAKYMDMLGGTIFGDCVILWSCLMVPGDHLLETTLVYDYNIIIIYTQKTSLRGQKMHYVLQNGFLLI